MKITLPESKLIDTLELLYFQDNKVKYLPVNQVQGKWVIEESLDADWFLYRVNGDFVICDALTKESLVLDEGFCATTELDLPGKRKYDLAAFLCSGINSHGKPTKKASYFTNLDPAAILAFEITSQEPSVVVTTEWIIGSKLYWLSSNHYGLETRKESYNVLALTPETPSGMWTVNTYLGESLYATHSFTLNNKSTAVSPRSGFMDIKV